MDFCVFFSGIKIQLNKLIAETNEYLLEDSNITLDQKEELLEYRKKIREFINSDDIQTIKKLTENIRLPTKPSFIDKV